MTRQEAEAFAAWNARDIETVLSHYDQNATFVSPRAALVTGQGTVAGRDALRTYW